MERELGGGTVLEAAYAGSKGTHLPRQYTLNQQPLIPGVKAGPRPIPVFGSIATFADISNSIYNSGHGDAAAPPFRSALLPGHVRLRQVDRRQFQHRGRGAADYPVAQNSYDLGAERGRSAFDVGHTFAASFIWRPKISRNQFLRDWQVSGTTTAYTGPPFTPKVANFDITTGGAGRPDRIAKGTLANPSPDQWFDRTAFPVLPLGAFRYGDSGRNVLDGPGTFALNTSLSRRFRLGETKAVQFRWEAVQHHEPNQPGAAPDTSGRAERRHHQLGEGAAADAICAAAGVLGASKPSTIWDASRDYAFRATGLRARFTEKLCFLTGGVA